MLPSSVQESKSILMRSWNRMVVMRSSGTLLCLGSGVAFGAMAIFGKLAYAEGASVGTLLAVRFVLAAALFWALSSQPVPPGRSERWAAATSRPPAVLVLHAQVPSLLQARMPALAAGVRSPSG
jgi:drug/metabolite transporter (DMT)-like permease